MSVHEETERLLAQTEDLCGMIEPVLHGRDPGVQGACLVQLTAKWFAGHHPEIRGEIIKEHLRAIFGLIPVFEREILDRCGGHWPTHQ